jgi:hypothetical protein
VSHTCHAPGCNRLVPPKMFACKPHWFALPERIRSAIWREYRPGQELDKDPSLRYLAVQRLACAYSVFRAYDEKAVFSALGYVGEAMRYAKECVEEGLGDPIEGLIPKDWPKPVKKANGRVKYL